MVALPIYLDHNATTPTDPRVLEPMLPFFTTEFGNPASRSHVFGWRAEEAVERARAQVAALLGAGPKEIIFTSGATESNNLAIKGVAHALRPKGNHIVTSCTEHRAVLDPCRRLAREGYEATFLPVDECGRISLQQLADAITDRTILVSLMAANNEIGTILPLAEVGAICRRRGVLFHTDASQAVGKIPIDVAGVDLLSVSGHKLYAPKGVGALYVRRGAPRVRIEPLVEGGGHERGLRSGTLAVPGIVGLGAACEIAGREMAEEAKRLIRLRDRLEGAILEQLEDVRRNGPDLLRLPGTTNLSFRGVEGEALMMAMKDVAVSSGSACSSADPEPSYVLRALGLDDEMARSSLRFSVGRFNTEEEIDHAAAAVVRTVEELRRLIPLVRGSSAL